MTKRGPYGPQVQFNLAVQITPIVKWLIIINIAVWLGLEIIIGRYIVGDPSKIFFLFGLVPLSVAQDFFVWQFLTYMFLHSFNVFHIVFNMLLLWWLGSELEQRWGPRFFLSYYLASGVGAALIYVLAVLLNGLFTGSFAAFLNPVVGASGAVFGLMLAYGIIFGERIVYFMMVFPMRAKYFVMILGAVELATLLSSGLGGSDVANLAHIGGLVSGFLFLQVYTRFQQRRWRRQSSRRGRGLRLVVNNDDKKEKDGPRYWH